MIITTMPILDKLLCGMVFKDVQKWLIFRFLCADDMSPN